MALKIQKARGIVYPLRMLVYGDSGAGKTYLAMQADMVEDMRPVLLVACDMGTSTARRTDIDVLLLEAPSELSKVLRALSQKQLPYKTVIIDGFSMFYDMLVYQRSSGDAPGIRDWMTASVDVKKLMQRFVKLGLNIIVTSLAQKLQEESSGQFYTCPLLPGKMAWRFPEAFDIVGYVSTRTTQQQLQRTLQVQPYRRVIAKDRDDTIGQNLLDITWTIGSNTPSPMERIWERWTAYRSGRSPSEATTVPLIELDEEEVKEYEEGGEDVFA